MIALLDQFYREGEETAGMMKVVTMTSDNPYLDSPITTTCSHIITTGPLIEVLTQGGHPLTQGGHPLTHRQGGTGGAPRAALTLL